MQDEAPKLVGHHVYSKGIAGHELKLLEEWGVFKRGTQVRPLNRGDLLKLIELNGGDAKYLNLSRMDMAGIDLRGLRLESMDLRGCNLQNAIAMPMVTLDTGDLPIGDLAYELALQKWTKGEKELFVQEVTPTILTGAVLSYANLSNADFRWANLAGAYLIGANLQGTALYSSNLSYVYRSYAVELSR